MYQFIHISSYASSASKKSKSTACIKSIAGEADRHAGYIKHLEQIAAPTILYGCSPTEAGNLAEVWGKNNKIRKDGHALLAGVISVDADFQNWQQYRNDCVDWLKKKYGNQLRSIVEHTDEAHPHLHFFAVPLDGERFDVLHEGEKARNEKRAMKQPTSEQNKAYKIAMKAFQADFHAQVSSGYGLSKDGPKKTRKTRAVYMAEKEAANTLQAAVSESEALVENGKAERVQIIERTEAQRVQFIKRTKAKAVELTKAIEQEAERKGFEAGQRKFERQPLIRKILTVVLRVEAFMDKRLSRMSAQLLAAKSKANSAIRQASTVIAQKNQQIKEQDARMQHIITAYDELARENRNFELESKKAPELNFAESNSHKPTMREFKS